MHGVTQLGFELPPPTFDFHAQDAAALVVLDDFFGEDERRGLLDSLGAAGAAAEPPGDAWERNTADDAHGSKTWGLKPGVLLSLAADPTPPMLEIQTRLVGGCPTFHFPCRSSGDTSELRLSCGQAHHRRVAVLYHECCYAGNCLRILLRWLFGVHRHMDTWERLSRD